MMRTPVNGKLLTDDELRDFAVLVLLGGMDTTSGVTGNTLLRGIITRIPDFAVQWEGVERFEDCGSVYAVRHLPVTFTPGKRLPDT